MEKAFVVGITGSTGSGKTTFTKDLQKELGDQAVLLSSDMYYKDQGLLPLRERLTQNMDCPEAFDNQLLITHIQKLVSGEDIKAPIYDFTDHTRRKDTRHLKAKPILIVEGLLIFARPQLRSLFDLKIFLEVPADLRLCRRILRDVAEKRSGSVKAAIDQYLTSARPMDKVYVLPQKKYADLVISAEEIASAQVQIAVDRIKEKMTSR
jgi:uridine kinase